MFVLVISILWLDFFHFNREKFCCFACTRPDTLQQYLFSFLWWTEKDTELPSQPITALPSVVYNHAVLFIVCLWCVCFSMLFRKHICDAPLCKDIFFIGATKKGERLRSFSCKSGNLLGYSCWELKEYCCFHLIAGVLGQLIVHTSHIGGYFRCSCCAIKPWGLILQEVTSYIQTVEGSILRGYELNSNRRGVNFAWLREEFKP